MVCVGMENGRCHCSLCECCHGLYLVSLFAVKDQEGRRWREWKMKRTKEVLGFVSENESKSESNK